MHKYGVVPKVYSITVTVNKLLHVADLSSNVLSKIIQDTKLNTRPTTVASNCQKIPIFTFTFVVALVEWFNSLLTF